MLIKSAILAVSNIKWTKHRDIPDEIMERNLPKEYSWEIRKSTKWIPKTTLIVSSVMSFGDFTENPTDVVLRILIGNGEI